MPFVDTWREPTSKTAYVCTGKEPDPLGDKVDMACWLLQGKIDSRFHGQPATVGQVYYEVMRPLGMSLEETKRLVKESKARGYLR
jgi:hypothetical protein